MREGTNIRLTVLMALAVLLPPCSDPPASKVSDRLLTGPYLGQTPPGKVPKVFAPGVVSTTAAAEWGIAFTPDGWQLYFTRRSTDDPTNGIWYMKAKKTVWSGPFPVPFNTNRIDMEPFVTYDGKTLFFSSDRPHNGVIDCRIWGVDILKSGWGPAWFASGSINDDFSMYLTISKAGTAVYTGPNVDLYSATYENRTFSNSMLLGPPISTGANDFHPLIAVDGSFIVFDSDRSGGYGDTDFYIAFRKGVDSWSDPVNLGAVVNGSGGELCAYVSPDRKYFFFGRFIGDYSDIYWVDASVLKSLRPSDMTCSAVTIKPGIVTRGETVELRAKITNRSGVYSMSTSASFYLDESPAIGDQSVQLGSADVDSIGPQKATILKMNALIPQGIAPGQYYLLASVDQEDWNCDPNRKNNVVRRTQRIVVK
ncbi:MAG: CARDB domain-containing protein [Acidobacteriota bacterium]